MGEDEVVWVGVGVDGGFDIGGVCVAEVEVLAGG